MHPLLLVLVILAILALAGGYYLSPLVWLVLVVLLVVAVANRSAL